MIPIIQTFQLTRRFGQVCAVEKVDLEVPQGSVYGFLGPNGAGKSTTIRMLLGLIRPSQGEVRLFGEAPARGRSGRAQRMAALRRIGSLVESPSIYPHLTGRENLEVIRLLRNLKRGDVAEALRTVRLEKDADRLARHYSTGMRQRLGLAIALLGRPELLILDEPTNGLDPAGIFEMRELLARLADETGTTIFLSSHLLNEIEQTASHLGIIQHGRLIFQGKIEDLQRELGEQITLGVDQPEQAARLLASEGWKVRYDGARQAEQGPGTGAEREAPTGALIVIEAGGEGAAARLNARLAAQGIQVFHLSQGRPTLEEVFLKLTGGQAGD